jgi:hypothetical protein
MLLISQNKLLMCILILINNYDAKIMLCCSASLSHTRVQVPITSTKDLGAADVTLIWIAMNKQ